MPRDTFTQPSQCNHGKDLLGFLVVTECSMMAMKKMRYFAISTHAIPHLSWHSKMDRLRYLSNELIARSHRRKPFLLLNLYHPVHCCDGGKCCVQGNMSFEEIFKCYYSKVFYFFVRKNVPEAEAEELTQEVFLRLHSNREQYRGDTSLRNWIELITQSIWKNYLRSRYTQKREGQTITKEDLNSLPENKERPDQERKLFAVANHEQLIQVIHELPSATRRTVILRVYHEMKYNEIAQTLGVSVDTVKSQLNKAKKLIKDKWKGEPPSF